MKFFALAFLLFHPAWAFSGGITVVEESGTSGENWRVEKPIVGIAVSFDQEKKIDRYIDQIKEEIKNAFPDQAVEVNIRYRARSFEVVQDLMNPRMVGYFLLGHTFQNSDLGTSVFVDADQNAYPNELLSAATPALRFFVFLGCHGEGLITQYQMKYELARLPGKQTVYVSNQALLGTSQSFVLSGLKKDIQEVGKQLKVTPPFLDGVESQAVISLSLTVRDVAAKLEPRFVYVNQAIVGTLGSSEQDSNSAVESRVLNYEVPAYRLKASHCQVISVRSVRYGSGSFLDDYILEEVKLGERNFTEGFPLHLGDNSEIPSFHDWSRDEIQAQLSKKNEEAVQRFLIEFFEQKEWLDRASEHWPQVSARFFQSCLH